MCTESSDVKDIGCSSTLGTNILKLQLTARTSLVTVSYDIPSSKIMESKLERKCIAVKYMNLELVAAESNSVKLWIREGHPTELYHIAPIRGKFWFVRGSSHYAELVTWAGQLVSSDEQRFQSVRDEPKTSQCRNSTLIICHFMHSLAPNVLSPATNMSIQRWYNKTTCGWCGSHYSANELSSWQSDLSANEASRPCAGGSTARGQPGDGLRRRAGVQHLTPGRAR